MRDRAISLKFFDLQGISAIYSCQFSKDFPLPKNDSHFEFVEFSAKMEKHKLASISLTVQDRGISSKFSTPGWLRNLLLPIFKKNFLSPKMVAILNFRILAKNAKPLICSISLTVQDRAILLKSSTHRVSKQSTLTNFQKIRF